VYEGSVIKSLNDMYIMGTYSRSIGVVNAELYRKSAGISNWKNKRAYCSKLSGSFGTVLKRLWTEPGRGDSCDCI
jgi:hypothetical protein